MTAKKNRPGLPRELEGPLLKTLIGLSEDSSVFSIDTEYRYTSFNDFHRRRMKEVIGTDIGIGINLLEIVKKVKSWSRIREDIDLAFSGEPVSRILYQPDFGMHFEYHIKPLENEGRILGAAIQLKDVSVQILNELKFRETSEKFRKIYEEGPIGMVMVNKDMQFIAANPSFCSMLGYSEPELLQMTIREVTHPDDFTIDLPNIKKLVKKEIAVYKTEKRYLHKDGREVWGALTVNVIFSDKGKFSYHLAFIENIHERKISEFSFRKLAERLDLATRSAKMGIWDWDIPSGSLEWDTKSYELFGFTRDPLPNPRTVWPDNIHPDDRENIKRITELALKGKQEYDTEFRVTWPDGSLHWLKTYGQVFFDTKKVPVRMIGIGYDISEKKKAEKALVESEDRFFRAFHSGPVAQLITKVPDGTILDVNDSYCRIVGYTREELLNRIPLEIGLWVNPADRKVMFKKLESDGRVREMEINFMSRLGEIRALIVSIEPTVLSGIPCIITSAVDITERKNAEKQVQQLNEELEEKVHERTTLLEVANNDLEAFSYSVSHDLRAPLRHINGYIALLSERYRDQLPDEGKHFMESIVGSANHMGNLIDDLLQFSRTGRQEMKKIRMNMNNVLQDVIASLQHDIQSRTIQWEIDPLPVILGDPMLLRLVWSNLLSNSIKFTRGKKVAKIRIGARDEPAETVFFVSDNGAGFDMKYVHKLFGVFQRLHSAKDFEGTGIGLANVRRIISKHGGQTWAESIQGQGATFYFSLPKTKKETI